MSSPRALSSEPEPSRPPSDGETPLAESHDHAKAVAALPSQIGLPPPPDEAVDAGPTLEQPRVSWIDLPRAPTMTAPPEGRISHGTAFERPLSSPSIEPVKVRADGSGAIEVESDPLVGTVIAERYRVSKLLGTGGMGRVYLAEHEALRKPVAVKVVHPELARDGDLAARFSREALVAGALDHPHVAGALDTGKLPDGGAFIVMQYARGALLRDALDASGCFDWRRTCAIAAQIADALDAAHAQRIIHRDLKPENLMLETRPDGTDHVRILDFGIARMSTDSIRPPAPGMGTLTRLGTGVGTPGYMPPEQTVGERIDGRADLYALGVIVYELVSGQPPYHDADLTRMLAKQLAGKAARLSDAAADPSIPPELDQLVASLIAPSKEDRPESAGRVRDALRRLISGSTSGETSMSGSFRTASDPSIRTRELAARPAPSTPLAITGNDLKRAWPIAPVAGLGCFAVLIAAAAVLLGALIGDDEAEQPAANAIKPVPTTNVPPAPMVVMPSTLASDDETRGRTSKGRGRDRDRDEERRDRGRSDRAQVRAASDPPRPAPIVVPSLEPPRPTTTTTSTPAPAAPADVEPAEDVAPVAPSAPPVPIPPELAADFAILQDSPRESERGEAARRLLARGPEALPPVVRASAELMLASGCTEKKRWIRELSMLGDRRVLPQIRRIARLPRRGCGFLGLGDCHDCYRGSASRALRVLGG
ncbi:MAG: serine/threonine protein kinase [Deltaproteobacteria bacterium]|nr:serine/threonine protein kinase [Deltaproteobacteria bacterium]